VIFRPLKEAIQRFLDARGIQVRNLRPQRFDEATYFMHYAAELIQKKRFYNIGAGAFRHPFWTNIDKVSDHYAALQKGAAVLPYDAMSDDPFPVAEGSAAVFYTSHMIEHIRDDEVRRLFGHVHRALMSGGIFRVVCPDMELEYRAYRNGDRSFFYWMKGWEGDPQATIDQLFVSHFAQQATCLTRHRVADPLTNEEIREVFSSRPFEEAMDYCAARHDPAIQRQNPGLHVSWWTADKLARFLKEAGFSDVYRSGYGQSMSPALRNTYYFDNSMPAVSLFVEGRK
jgi:predicted SAM-dependent methyltransferase